MLLDADQLLFAGDERSSHHRHSKDWLMTVVNGDERVVLPWLSLTAFRFEEIIWVNPLAGS